MSTCLTCAILNLHDYSAHAKVGYGRCKNLPGASFCSIRATVCKKYEQLPSEKAEARVSWSLKFDREK